MLEQNSIETFETAICIIFSANELTKEGYFFKVHPKDLKNLIDRAYQRYPSLRIDMAVVNSYMRTLSKATNAIPIVREAMEIARNRLND